MKDEEIEMLKDFDDPSCKPQFKISTSGKKMTSETYLNGELVHSEDLTIGVQREVKYEDISGTVLFSLLIRTRARHGGFTRGHRPHSVIMCSGLAGANH